MAWIAAAIGAVGTVASASIRSNGSGGGGMALPSNGFDDHSMGNTGFVVTTNGSRANVTTTDTREKSPQLGQTTPIYTGGGGLGGLDMTTVLIIAGLLLLARKKA